VDETDPGKSNQKTPSAKRTARQKSYDERIDSQLSSTKAVKNIKKEKCAILLSFICFVIVKKLL
jgi:hypothetical protein